VDSSAGSGGVIGGGGAGGSGSAGAGGRTGAGGAGAGAGGRAGSGGATATGGAVGSGGVTGPGGAVGGGGAVGAGSGGRGTGGASGTGGAIALGTGGAVGTGGATGTGGSGGRSCTTPPAAPALVGWASVNAMNQDGTSGGGNAAPVTVTTTAAFNSAAAGTTARVLYVTGALTGVFTIGSNKTIVGLCGASLHGHVEMSGSVNVIVRNLNIVGYAVGDCALDPSYDASIGCSSGDDAISLQKLAHHVWFDHDDISDGTDGNLDITNGANYVTVSWTKFHYTPRADNSGSDSTGASGHRFSNLVGGSDSTGATDAGALNVTWHHDWWSDNVVERQPRVRFGKNHLFNNLWASTASNYCVRAGIDAQILLESNLFTGVANPQEFNSSADQATAFITATTTNVYTNTSGTRATGGGGTAFTTPPYAYTLDAVGGLQAAVQAGAGPK
jgi:pectate lyase